MFDPHKTVHHHQIEAKIAVMANLPGIAFKGAGNSDLLTGTQCKQRCFPVGPVFDFDCNQDFAAPGDDINFTDRAFMAGCKDAIPLQAQKQGTQHFCAASGLFRPLAT